MPPRKRQHFVPQFYLENFAEHELRKFVSLYNFRNDVFVGRAPLGSQSYKDYFYGKDGRAEESFGVVEGAAARVIGEMIRCERTPIRFGPDHHILATFLVLQAARTVQAEAETIEMADKAMKVMLKHELRDQPELVEGLDRIRLTATNAVSLSIKQALRAAPLINDLKLKLLVNATSVPFVSSDHPVVRLNSLYSSLSHRSVTGLGNVGLQILLPLSPRHAILFYDEDAYEIGDRTSNILRLTAPAHVRSINALQWRFAHEQVYFQPGVVEADVRQEAATHRPFRNVERIQVTDEVLCSDDDGHRVLLRMQGQASASIQLPRTRRLLKPEQLGEMTPLPLRHPQWARDWHAVNRAVEAGDLPESAFGAFAKLVPRRPRCERESRKHPTARR